MPPVEVEVGNSHNEEQPAQAAKASIGIIYPPPEVRNIVDKTASFVARNGPEFESRIRQNELNNPKFNFLNPSDPYNAYYRHKVREFVEGRGQEPSSAPKSGLGFMQQKPQEPTMKIIEPVVPKEPPPEFEFIIDPPSISAADLDVVKLTAQFTARNGRQFLTNLMQKESRNYQFDFLRPQHSLFNYFTKLVEQYTKILIPPKDLVAKLRAEVENPKLILEQAKYRVEWAKHQDRERKREEDEREKERVAYAQIDWHDFVVVETIDYVVGEPGTFPPPTTPDEVGARVLAQERYEEAESDDERDDIVGREKDEAGSEDERSDGIGGEEEEREEPGSRGSSEAGGGSDVELDSDDEKQRGAARQQPTTADTNIQDMDEDSADEEDMLPVSRGGSSQAPPLPPSTLPPAPPAGTKEVQPPPLPPNPQQVLIKHDYNPKVMKSIDEKEIADKFLISPITGEKISADKIHEHLRIGLLDPRWIEQKERQIAEKREQEEVYAPGSSIGSQLRQLAERRSDIFGSGVEEVQIGKKIGEEEKKEKQHKVIWDGHSGSMEKVTQKARENISIEDQIAVIHKVQGLVADDDKEKIGPAMPKKSTLISAPPPPPPAPVSTYSGPPMTSGMGVQPPRPPGPPVTSSMGVQPPRPPSGPSQAPVSRPPLVNPPLPPRPPVMGGLPQVSAHTQPGMMMSHQPILGLRPPMPPMMSGGGPMPPHMMMQPQTSAAAAGQLRPPMPPASRPTPSAADKDDEPVAKKSKTEEQLIPEHVFLAQHQGPVTFRVQVPTVSDKSEWKLNGQIFTVTLPLTDNVAVIKAKVFDETGMPAGKQKLQLEGMFLKDSNTLAYYNFTPMSVVSLQLKERGGRKK